MITGLGFVLFGVLVLVYPQLLAILFASFLILFGLGMTPPPVCWPKAGRWALAVQCGIRPATRVAFGDAKQVVG